MIGETIGPYRLVEELGSGGMGAVYLAEVVNEESGFRRGDRVALKIVHPALLSSPGFFKRFLREAELGKVVENPNVVRTHDCDAIVIDGVQHNYLVMEYVEGQTVRDLLVELGTLPEELVLHIGREIAKGLSAIHAAGAIHRDLKPENVLITPDHVVKVMDLGVARLTEEAARLSQAGTFLGSMHYASPEQFRGDADVEGRADLHALGLILYELCCGANPYESESLPRVIRNILSETPRRLGELCPQLSPFFEEVIHTLLRKERENRFPSANDLLRVLDEAEESAWWRERARSSFARTARPLRRLSVARETAVYGRTAEISRLGDLLARAHEGEGQVALIEGEAGVGKSRLADEFVAELGAEDVTFLFGAFPPGGAATGADAFLQAYRDHVEGVELETALADHLQRSPRLVPAFAALVRGESPPESVPMTKGTLQTAFVHTTRALAAERTTVILIEDLHYTTDDGRALFAALTHSAPGNRLLLIGTTRPGLPDDWLAEVERLPQFSRIPLDRLGADDLGRLLEEAFSSREVARELSDRIATKSDGNPFYVFEIIRELREAGALAKRSDGSWATTRGIERIEIPTSVRDLLRSRIAGLTEEERELLDVAACAGFTFDASLVADAIGRPRVPVLRRFARLEGTLGIIRSAGRRFVFDHSQIPEMLYEAMPVALREEYHAVLGSELQARVGEAGASGAAATEICEHFIEGGRPERARPYLEAALAHLRASFRHDLVTDLALRALACEGLLAGRDRLSVLLHVAGSLDTLGRREEEARVIEEAIALSDEGGDGTLRARALGRRGWYLAAISRNEEAREALSAGVALAREAEDEEVEAQLTRDLGISLFSLGRHEEARVCHERHLELSTRLGDARGEANAAGNLGNVLFVLGRLDEAEERYQVWLSGSRAIGNRRGEAAATGNLGTIRFMRGRFEEAMEHHERNRGLCRQIGYRVGEARATYWIGMALRAIGRYAEARDEFEEYLRLSRATGHRRGEAIASVQLGGVSGELGDLEGARPLVESAVRLAEEIGVASVRGDALHAAGCHEELAGNLHEAERHYAEALQARRTAASPGPLAETLAALGRVRLERGRIPEAVAALEEACGLATGQDAAGIRVLAELSLAFARGDEGESARALYEGLLSRLEHGERMEAEYLLYRITGDENRIAEARRLLGERAAQGKKGAALREVALHRAIHAGVREIAPG